MTPEAQRIAIAEACGWKKCRAIRPGHLTSRVVGISPPFCGMESSSEFDVPDYPNDLNEMHEAEMSLPAIDPSQPDRVTYRFNLGRAVGNDPHAIHATAAQRAEAFIDTLGLRDDSK